MRLAGFTQGGVGEVSTGRGTTSPQVPIGTAQVASSSIRGSSMDLPCPFISMSLYFHKELPQGHHMQILLQLWIMSCMMVSLLLIWGRLVVAMRNETYYLDFSWYYNFIFHEADSLSMASQVGTSFTIQASSHPSSDFNIRIVPM